VSSNFDKIMIGVIKNILLSAMPYVFCTREVGWFHSSSVLFNSKHFQIEISMV
jgi:hypothetical protein